MQLAKFQFCIFKQILKLIMKVFHFLTTYFVPRVSKIISWGTKKD